MNLPRDIEELILDYYWSLRIFELKRMMHRELRHLWVLREVHIYYDIYYNTFPEALMLHGLDPPT